MRVGPPFFLFSHFLPLLLHGRVICGVEGLSGGGACIERGRGEEKGEGEGGREKRHTRTPALPPSFLSAGVAQPPTRILYHFPLVPLEPLHKGRWRVERLKEVEITTAPPPPTSSGVERWRPPLCCANCAAAAAAVTACTIARSVPNLGERGTCLPRYQIEKSQQGT